MSTTSLYTILAAIVGVDAALASQVFNDPGRGALLLVAMAILLLCREVSRK